MNICSKNMEMSSDFKKKLESTIDIKNVEYTFISGQLIQFKKSNINCINPNKIIIKKSGKEVIILYYGEYYYEEDAISLYDIHNKCSLNRLKKLLG